MAQLKWTTLAEFERATRHEEIKTKTINAGRTQTIEYRFADELIAKCVKFYDRGGKKCLETAWFVDKNW